MEQCSVYQAIQAIASPEDVLPVLAQLHLAGCFVLFQPFTELTQSRHQLVVKQGHFTLHQRSAYLNDDDPDRLKYIQYIQDGLQIPLTDVNVILDLERQLLEQGVKFYAWHIEKEQVRAIICEADWFWATYFKAVGLAPKQEWITLTGMSYFDQLKRLVQDPEWLPRWKTYFEFKYLEHFGPYHYMTPPLRQFHQTCEITCSKEDNAMGAIIGLEFMHLFDPSGRMYDDQVQPWSWNEDEKQVFDLFTRGIAQQYGQYQMYGQAVNGERTQYENMADIGGLTIAFDALLRSQTVEPNPEDEDDPKEWKRCFFMAWCQSFRF